MSLSVLHRREFLERMAQDGVDVLVIGGGITGAGIALDAASRGLRVGLVDQADFAGGTSSRSTKLIHGGIRYLPQFEISLVREALHERALLLNNAPHLAHPVPFFVPLYSGMRRPLGMKLPGFVRPFMPIAVAIGLWGYDVLAGRQTLLRHRSLSVMEAKRLVPLLRTEGLQRGYLYWDARTDDVRLTLAVLRTAASFGAILANYAKVEGLRHSHEGKIEGAVVRDVLNGRQYSIRATHVVNAAGVWGKLVADLDGPHEVRLTHSKGIHLVLPRAIVGVKETAVVIPETDDGRLAFLAPWEGHAVLGTTDHVYEGDLANPEILPHEVAYLLEHANRILRVSLQPQDVIGAYAGLRPLAALGGRSADLSRNHQLLRHPSGLLSIIGGKLTTYRKMAQDVVNEIELLRGECRPCRTHSLPLIGGEKGITGIVDVARRAHSLGLSPEVVEHLWEAYGTEAHQVLDLAKGSPDLLTRISAGLPYLHCEIVHAVMNTMAVSLEDVLVRRLRMALVTRNDGAAFAQVVATLMGEFLGWQTRDVREQIEHYTARPVPFADAQ